MAAAFWVVRKGCVPEMLPVHDYDQYGYDWRSAVKRRASGGSSDFGERDVTFAKKPRFEHRTRQGVTAQHYHHHQNCSNHQDSGRQDDSLSSTANLPFIVIREHPPAPDLHLHTFDDHSQPSSSQPHLLNPHFPSPAPMERTASGHSISSSDTPPPDEHLSLLSDSAAAQMVHKHLSGVNRNARHARILRALVYPKTPSSSRDFTIDDDALESIFSAANDLFFANKLRGRVTWDWSHPDMASAGRYDCAIVGTTALRKRKGHRAGGYETLIVLSSPILRDTKYNRRLLISTFLHEMIHSFLFVMCGRKAGINGGHTDGFHKIAADIDDWVGRECLRLKEMEADLERFTVEDHCDPDAPLRQNAVFAELHAHSQAQPYEQYHHHCRGGDPYHETTQSHRHYDDPLAERPYPQQAGKWPWQRKEGFGTHARNAY